MATGTRAAGQDPFAAGTYITYETDGTLTRLLHRWDTMRPVVGRVVTDIVGVVTYDSFLPTPISVVVATGGIATPGKAARAGGTSELVDGFTDFPVGSGNAHFAAGIFATPGAPGDTVQMHPLPFYCTGGDVE